MSLLISSKLSIDWGRLVFVNLDWLPIIYIYEYYSLQIEEMFIISGLGVIINIIEVIDIRFPNHIFIKFHIVNQLLGTLLLVEEWPNK